MSSHSHSHSRHSNSNSNSRPTSIAISTCSAIRSRSPSPSPSAQASPSSPTPTPTSENGLNRRLSWNRSREREDYSNSTTVQQGLTLTAPSRTQLIQPQHQVYPDERDIVYYGETLPVDQVQQPFSMPRSNGNRPFFQHQIESDASLESSGSVQHSESASASGNTSFSEDRERLTPNPAPGFDDRHTPHGLAAGMGMGIGMGGPRRSPGKKPYQGSSTGTRRQSTLRAVSRSLRKASVRVVNIMGKEGDGGRTRLGSEDEYEEEPTKSNGVDGPTIPMTGLGIALNSTGPDSMGMGMVPPPKRPEPRPPELGLRGRTLGVFTRSSRFRKSMDSLMRYPWTEPIILLLIITNVVVLAIQSAAPLNTPRIDDGYFQSWEDFVLLGLFILFTFEMFARIVVTGLILDPDISFRNFLFSPTGIIPSIQRRFGNAQTNLQRNVSKSVKRAAWRNPHLSITKPPITQNSGGGKKVTKILPEAPFQKAVAKSKSLSAQGRPYLRHSWHRIDMIAVVAYWITFILAISGYEATANRHVYIFRSLSVLRAGRLLVITSGTTTILHSLKRAGPLLITVAYFLIFAGGIFSIIGVQSFRGSFRRACTFTDPNNSSNIITLDQQCGGYLDPNTLSSAPYLNWDGSVSPTSPKGFICPLGQVCMTTDSNPNDGVQSFDNVFSALVQIIIISSINTWAPIMYSAMDSDFYSSSLFFLSGVIVLNFWLINLLIAVVVNTFSDIRAETRRSAFGGDETFLDPQWAAENKKKRASAILKFYERTELFWVILVVADLVAQGTKTSESSTDMIQLLKNLELAFTFAFDLEIIIRISCYFPDWRSFFQNGRNSFDLFLAITTSIIQIPVISSASIYPWLTAFQLARWYRVILAFPRMRPLLVMVFGSFAGLLNMVVFLFLMNFLGALMALQLFRGDIASGETMTFSQTYNSFLAMYQIFSSENWTTVLYSAMGAEAQYLQGWIAAIFLCGWFLFSNFIVLQMFIAVINENFAIAEEQKRKQQIEAFIRKSEPQSVHVSWIDRLNPYRLMTASHNAVKVDNLPPNLVLPLKQNMGADISSMQASDLGAWGTTAGAKGAMRRLLGRDRDESDVSLRRLRRPLSTKRDALNDDEEDDDRGLTDLLPPLNAGPSTDEHMDALRERRNQQADFIAAHPSFDQSLWLFKQSNRFRHFCQACVAPAYGERIFGRPALPILSLAVKVIVFLAVVASIVVAAIASPLYRRNYYEQHGIFRGTWFDLSEVGLGAVFIIEAMIKIIADGFIFAPNAYLLSLWNVLDFIILITLLVNTTTSLIFIGGLSRVTRALKSFRALRLITLFGRLRDTLHAVLFAGALKILDASILLILYIIPFAVWGLNLFSGLLYLCNDDDASDLASCISEYSSSPVDDSLSFLVPRVWANPGLADSTTQWAFDTFRQAILCLFESISLEGWIDVMSSLMNIVGKDQQAQDLASQWNAIYMLIFNLFGGVIILTLFVSIIIRNFSTRSGNALLTSEQRQWVDLGKFIKAQTPSRLPKGRPGLPVRRWCYDRAVDKDGYWSTGYTWIYYIHILLLMTEDFSNNILTDYQLDWIFLGLTILYAIDILVRFYGLGLRSFRANGWNLFDVVVIAGSFTTTIPALQAAASGMPTNQVNVQLQKLFLVSISFKLVQRISSLNQLFKTSVASLPAIGNLFLLWATIFIFYAILYLEVFGLTKMGNNAGTRFQNYYSFGNTLIMLAFMSTGEGWNGYMHDYTITTPRCTESDSFLTSDCGSAGGAFALFISWNIVSMYIFLNMFTGVVVESFAYVYQMPGGSSLNREEMRAFKKLWTEFDTQRTGYIRRKDFIKFFARLSGVFEVRLYPTEYSIPNLVRSSIPDPIDNASGRLLVVTGVKSAVDIRKVEAQIAQIDYRQVRARRQLFSRLYHEARISEDPGRGISFTAMLMMLAHYKLIDDEKALQLDDLLARRAKNERVTDLVNLDRVRGLLRTVYWRRKFIMSRDERRRTLNAEAEGIPAIVLEPMPATPPMEEMNAFQTSPSKDHNSYVRSPSPPHSPINASPAPDFSRSPDISLGAGAIHEGAKSHSPTPSLSISANASPRSRPNLVRWPSGGSMLSSEDAHYRRESPTADDEQNYFESMATSVWGDMMREANDTEDN